MQVADCWGDLDDVGDGLVRGKGTVAGFADLLQRLAAHVLHDDVADREPGGVDMLDEVIDPDNIRVFYLGESEDFGRGGSHGVSVA